MKNIVVQKYGGSSVSDAERLRNVAKRVIATKEAGNKVVVVVSAMGDTTDDLISLSQEVSLDPSNRELDMLLSTGEQVSASMLALTISSFGHDAKSLTGFQCGIKTTDFYKNARITDVDTERILNELKTCDILIITGFQGINSLNDITTLGRGGSDTSAVAFACSLKALQCEIYTDVDGIYTTDPRIIENAKKIDTISYDEMLELASLGAGVLHPRSVEMARKNNMKMVVKSSMVNGTGTEVVEVSALEKAIVSGVTIDENIVKISVMGVPDKPGIAFKLFSALGKNNVYYDMIIQNFTKDSVNDITFTVSSDDLQDALKVTSKVSKELGAERVLYDEDVVKVSIVGTGIAGSAGIASAFFESLFSLGINIQMISTSEIKISCIIEKDKGRDALKALHERFCE